MKKDTSLEAVTARFRPMLTPHEMLKLGVFRGNYFGANLPAEFPTEWNEDVVWARDQVNGDVKLNAFRVNSGLDRADWEARGWMNDQDPIGWFQWYCRYYLGRRSGDDLRQITRWVNFIRHSTNIINNSGGDIDHSPVRRQALLHWAWDPCPDFPTTTTVFAKVDELLS